MTTPKHPIDEPLPVEELAALRHAGRSQDFTAGQVVFRRGEHGDTMYVIEEGAVDLRFVEEKSGKRLGPGAFFGELALLRGSQRRTASALVTEPTRLCVLDQKAFLEAARIDPGVLLALLQRTCAYLVDSEQHLIADLHRKNRELERTLDFLRRTKEDLDERELQAQTDELTGLYNRRCLNAQLQKFMIRAQLEKRGLGLLVVDLDRLKPINDSHGHAVGDEVLKRLAEKVRHCFRRSDLPCRIGGDEFAVLVYDVDDDQGSALGEALRREIAALDFSSGDEAVAITVSVGGTSWIPGESGTALFERADQALYGAKRGGRNQVRWTKRPPADPASPGLAARPLDSPPRQPTAGHS